MDNQLLYTHVKSVDNFEKFNPIQKSKFNHLVCKFI